MNKLREEFRGRVHYAPVLKCLSKLKGNLRILEVGAQDEVLRKFVPKNMSYSSLDMYGNPDYKVDLNNHKIPVKNNTFDVLICLETLEHTLYPKKIIEELKRVTKKEGLFILSMPNEYNLWLRLLYFFAIKPVHTDEPFEVVSKFQHIHKPRVKDILYLFSKNFKILKVISLWQSRLGNRSNFFYSFDKLINLLAQISSNLFARVIIVIAKNKENDSEKNK